MLRETSRPRSIASRWVPWVEEARSRKSVLTHADAPDDVRRSEGSTEGPVGTAKHNNRYHALSLHKTVCRAEPLGRKTLFVECDYMIRVPLLCGALICSMTGAASAQSYPTLRPPRGAVPLLDGCNGMSGYPDCHPDRIYQGRSVAIRGIHLFPPGAQFYPAYRR
jgi:hypothetical protein